MPDNTRKVRQAEDTHLLLKRLREDAARGEPIRCIQIRQIGTSAYCPHCDNTVTPLMYLEYECPCCGAPITNKAEVVKRGGEARAYINGERVYQRKEDIVSAIDAALKEDHGS